MAGQVLYVFPMFIAMLFFSFSSCSKQEKNKTPREEYYQNNGKLKVLCTTKMVFDVVKEIGNEDIDAALLIQGQSDPHSYQLVKGDDEKIARADVIFFSGLGLEHGPSLVQYLKNNPKAHGLGDYVYAKAPDKIIHFDSAVDPHVWMDVHLWKESIPMVTEVLDEKMPEKGSEFKKNAKLLERKFEEAHGRIIKILHTVPENKRYLVTTHDAFNYFTRAYLCTKEDPKGYWKVRCQAPEGLSPDSQLSTMDIQNLVDHLLKYKISVVFAESNVSRDSIKKLCDATQKNNHAVRIAKNALYADACGAKNSEVEFYPDMLLYDAKVIKEELER